MKKPLSNLCFTFFAVCLLPVPLAAAGATNSPAIAAAAHTDSTIIVREEPATTSIVMPLVSSAAPSRRLPYGVEDVLRLSQAQINEEVILNYVQGSGTIYNLAPNDIVYLRNEGVSDRVLNTMLDQRKKANEAAQVVSQPAPAYNEPAPAFSPVYPDPTVTYGDVAYSPVYTPPIPIVEEPPASTLYVIPYYSAGPTFYRSYPRYYYSGSYLYYNYGSPLCRPGKSFAYRFGGHGHFRGRHRH